MSQVHAHPASRSYTPFNLPATITGTNPQIPDLGQASYSYQYDGDHARVKETYTAAGVPASGGGAGTTITTYVGNGFFEKVENADGSTEYRNYLSGPDGTLGLWSVNNGLGAFRLWHKDPLGSPILEYGTGGSETQFGFDPWGLRRKGDHTDAGNLTKEDLSTSGTYSAHFTPRGFTGHQHLDGLGLIHMNGRIYDPVIGRFLQADPIVQEPFNGQNFNRYTYVLNNPLAYTDPTGYSFWTEVRRPVGAIVATWLLMPGAYGFFGVTGISSGGVFGAIGIGGAYASTMSAVAAGFAAGGIAGGNVESAVIGAFTGGMLDAVGAATMPWYERALAHAMIGCMGAGLNGDCGRSALAGGFASMAGAALSSSGLQGWDNIATRSVIGGAASAIAGGKFANGAFTAAFNYLLNDKAHESRIKAGQYAHNLGNGFEGFVDPIGRGLSSTQAEHEIHVYKDGKEAGIFKDGEFINKHGKSSEWPKGFTQDNFNKLKGVDVDQLRAQGRLPEKGQANIKGNNYGGLIRGLGAMGYLGLYLDFHELVHGEPLVLFPKTNQPVQTKSSCPPSKTAGPCA